VLGLLQVLVAEAVEVIAAGVDPCQLVARNDAQGFPYYHLHWFRSSF
jgi:hypothetical protein